MTRGSEHPPRSCSWRHRTLQPPAAPRSRRCRLGGRWLQDDRSEQEAGSAPACTARSPYISQLHERSAPAFARQVSQAGPEGHTLRCVCVTPQPANTWLEIKMGVILSTFPQVLQLLARFHGDGRHAAQLLRLCSLLRGGGGGQRAGRAGTVRVPAIAARTARTPGSCRASANRPARKAPRDT